ncbi:MAG: Uma2 family endonuclease [Parasporobacterium sp.]|nr:Uma2 family endonuclease [Parasporobacterium sp.]
MSKDLDDNDKSREPNKKDHKESCRQDTYGQETYKGKAGDDFLQEPSAAEAYIENAGEGSLQLQNRKRPEQTRDLLPFQDPRIPSGGGHTEEEYLALPDDLRVELIDGVFYAMASPQRLHQRVAFEIAKQLDACIEEHGLPCFLYIAPSDVALGDDKKTVVQPDVYVHCDIEKDKGTGPFRGSPDFAAEVLSPSNPENDLWRKRELYRRHGIREYWIINPQNCKVYVFVFENSGKEEGSPGEYSFEDLVPVHISDGSCAVDFRIIYQKIKHMLE